jgi:two-component system, sensor histidine kinase and response regulator
MVAAEFDLLELMESSALQCSTEALTRQHAIVGYMEPQLARMYVGERDKIAQVLVLLAQSVMKLDSQLDICIRATNGNVYQDDSIGVVPLRFAVHYTFEQEPNDIAEAERLIAELGGSLRYGVEKGKGSFVSFLCKLQASDNQVERPLFIDELSGIPMFVLSNEPPPNRAIHGNLRYWGLRCDGAPTFQEGILEISRQASLDNSYQLVIVSQPIEDGSATDVAREVRSSALGKSTKLIHIDRFYSDTSRDESMAAGFDAYMAKPFTTDELLKMISAQLNVKLGAGGALKHPEVLIVEDNLTNQKIAMFQLRRLGITADICPNGKEALIALSRKSYALVLMDLQMPVMDGFETVTEIRKRAELKHLPIVAFTSNDDDESRRRALSVGMNDYFTKPVTPEDYKKLLQKWCPAALNSALRKTA